MELGGNADLAREALSAQQRGEIGTQHLDGDLGIVLQVARQVHGRHAAASDFAHDGISPGEQAGLFLLRVDQRRLRMRREVSYDTRLAGSWLGSALDRAGPEGILTLPWMKRCGGSRCQISPAHRVESRSAPTRSTVHSAGHSCPSRICGGSCSGRPSLPSTSRLQCCPSIAEADASQHFSSGRGIAMLRDLPAARVGLAARALRAHL
jgi:hypothetical protein